MSYARFAEESDVYVYASARGGIECQRCRFIHQTETTADSPRNNAVMVDEDEMIAHLEKHRRAGQQVPESALEGLRRDRDARGTNGGK